MINLRIVSILCVSVIAIISLFFTFQKKQESGPSFKLLREVPVKADLFTTDNLGQIYIVTGGLMQKHDATGGLIQTFNNKLLGNIYCVDATNPMRILLFYKDMSHLVFLDNMMNIIGSAIPLGNYGLGQSTLCCASQNNGIWLYIQKDFELLRLDRNMGITHRSGNVSQTTGRKTEPVSITEHGDFIYINDTMHGIMVFDLYATFHKTVPIKGVASFQIADEKIIYYTGLGDMKIRNLKTLDEKSITMPDTAILQVRFENRKLYLLKENTLNIYNINQ